MVDYREILRLHNLGYSQRVITSSVHSSRSTVKEVIDLANALRSSGLWMQMLLTQTWSYSCTLPGQRRIPTVCPLTSLGFTGNLQRKALR